MKSVNPFANLFEAFHEGSVVMVEGGIMYKPKVSALFAQDCYYIACTMH